MLDWSSYKDSWRGVIFGCTELFPKLKRKQLKQEQNNVLFPEFHEYMLLCVLFFCVARNFFPNKDQNNCFLTLFQTDSAISQLSWKNLAYFWRSFKKAPPKHLFLFFPKQTKNGSTALVRLGNCRYSGEAKKGLDSSCRLSPMNNGLLLEKS